MKKPKHTADYYREYWLKKFHNVTVKDVIEQHPGEAVHNGCHRELIEEYVDDAIALHEASQWKKYPEYKPKEYGNDYFVTLKNGEMWNYGYWDNGFGINDSLVVAWIKTEWYPPKPYQEEVK